MKIEALPDNFIDDLLAEDKLEDWPDEEVFVCPHCGACKDPDHCVMAVQCPECFAPPHELCLDERGAKTGLHQARWNHAGTDWRVK